jgi:hypothetical protein
MAETNETFHYLVIDDRSRRVHDAATDRRKSTRPLAARCSELLKIRDHVIIET